MAIETICSGCAKKLRVGDEHAGKQARCPDCGTIYTVPKAVEEPLSARPLGSIGSGSFANPPAKEIAVERWLMKIDDGREFGPVERQVLDSWFAERRIGATTQIKRETDTQWAPASAFYPSLASTSFVPSPSQPAGNPFADQTAFNPYVAPGALPANNGYREPHRGGLILALALIGWFTCFLLGTVAWVMASQDLSKMRSGQMDPSGEGLTRAGQIIGILVTVFSVVIILAAMALMAIGIAVDN